MGCKNPGAAAVLLCSRCQMLSFPDMRCNRKVSNPSRGNQHNAFRTPDPCELIDTRRVKERGY